jgi:hypothetical protein
VYLGRKGYLTRVPDTPFPPNRELAEQSSMPTLIILVGRMQIPALRVMLANSGICVSLHGMNEWDGNDIAPAPISPEVCGRTRLVPSGVLVSGVPDRQICVLTKVGLGHLFAVRPDA